MSRKSGILVVALTLVSWGRDASAFDDESVQKSAMTQLGGWLKNEENVAPFKAAIPPEINLGAGVLGFPTPQTPVWEFTLPKGKSLGPRKDAAVEALKKLFTAYLDSAGEQALEFAPEEQRSKLLEQWKAGAEVRIVESPTNGGDGNLGGNLSDAVSPESASDSRSSSLGAPQYVASPQSLASDAGSSSLGSPQYVATPQSLTWGQPAQYVPTSYQVATGGVEALMNRGFEAYWSGDTQTALHQFRSATVAAPHQATAYYFQALSELSGGDRPAAETSLRAAAAAEARSKSSRAVSLALVRVQGPVRLWLEEGRRSAQVELSRK